MHLGPHGTDSHCNHHHEHVQLNRSFAIAVVLNVMLVIGETIGGFVSGSMALLADAGHNLGDVAGLVLAWWAHHLRQHEGNERWSYGMRGFTILAANLNGLLILAAIVGVSVESIRRLWAPSEVAGIPVMIVAAFAALLNFATARLLVSKSDDDLNVRGAYLHMVADAAVSLAVVLGAGVMLLTGWNWVDPAISLAICVVLSIGTWQLLKESTSMMMHAVPKAVNLPEVRSFLSSFPEVKQVADLHVWSVSTTDVLLTSKLHCPELEIGEQDAFLQEIHEGLREEWGISHATLEVVRGDQAVGACALKS